MAYPSLTLSALLGSTFALFMGPLGPQSPGHTATYTVVERDEDKASQGPP